MLTWTPQQYPLLNLSDKSLRASVSAVSLQPLLVSGKSTAQKKCQCTVLGNVLITKTKSPPFPSQETLVKERHKYFDEVIISVRAGDGGHGAILCLPNKRDFDGSLILPVGGHGIHFSHTLIRANVSSTFMNPIQQRVD